MPGKTLSTVLGMAAAVMLLNGCASLPGGEPQGAEAQVSERSLARDRAYQEGDLEAVYDYFSPGYKQTMSLERYRNQLPFSVDLKDSEVLDVTCDDSGERCEVKKRWVYQLDSPMGKAVGDVDKVKKEVWIRIKDEWYYYQD